MKYSVGDIFLDSFGSTVIIIGLSVQTTSYEFLTKDQAGYIVTIDGTKSHLRWYDGAFSTWKNITTPVMKELYGADQ